MTPKISRCNSCGEFFNSKRELKEHIDKNHRITDSKVAAAERTTKRVTLSSSIKNSKLGAEE
jgi:uncharacterized C2H2 Zn-finger protein